MTRVLHLLSGDPNFQAERGSAGLGSHLGAGFEVVRRTVGRGGDYRNLAFTLLGLRGKESAGFDVIHAFDEPALTAAALATALPVVYSPSVFLGRRAMRWVRAVMQYRDVHLACPTATLHRAAVERGLPPARCHVIRPGVDFSRVRRRRDPALRAALGLNADHHVILAPGESTEPAAHEQAVWAGSVLGVLDDRHRVLIWGRGARAARAAKLGVQFRQPDLVHVAEERLGRRVAFEELLPAVDSVLISARGPVSTLPILTCMAAALPIVSTVTYGVAELLEDRHNALMVPKDRPRLLARRVLEMREDSRLQWTIADTARAEAFEHFSLTRFVGEYRALYGRAVGSRQRAGQSAHSERVGRQLEA